MVAITHTPSNIVRVKLCALKSFARFNSKENMSIVMFILKPYVKTKVEYLFMIIHLKPCFPTTRLISFGKGRGIMCQQNGKKLN
jgi:hypothetical protein